MRSEFFSKVGLSDTEWEITPRLDEYGLPRLWFISGEEHRSLDLSAVRKVAKIMRENGQEKNADQLDDLIETAKELSLRNIRR